MRWGPRCAPIGESGSESLWPQAFPWPYVSGVSKSGVIIGTVVLTFDVAAMPPNISGDLQGALFPAQCVEREVAGSTFLGAEELTEVVAERERLSPRPESAANAVV